MKAFSDALYEVKKKVFRLVIVAVFCFILWIVGMMLMGVPLF